MKAVVVEIRNDHAAVLSDDGCVVTIENNEYAIGQVVDMKNIRLLKIRFLKWVACAAATIAICSATAWAYFTPYCYVSMDVNPSVEYSINIFDRVIWVKAVNDDGAEILKEVSFRNKKIEDVVPLLMETIEKNGYFDKEETNGIVIAASCDNYKKAEALAEMLRVKAAEQNSKSGNDTEISVVNVALDRVAEAHRLGITPGKLNLVQKLQASAEKPEDVKVEDWINRPVKEIMKAVKENRKLHKNEEATDIEDSEEKEITVPDKQKPLPPKNEDSEKPVTKEEKPDKTKEKPDKSQNNGSNKHNPNKKKPYNKSNNKYTNPGSNKDKVPAGQNAPQASETKVSKA